MSTAREYPDVILALQQKKAELGESNQGMVDLVLQAGKITNKGTADKIFKPGAEHQRFRYVDSLQPYVEVFLVEDPPAEPKTLEDARDLKLQLEALQTVVAEKGEMIALLRQQVSTQQRRIETQDEMVNRLTSMIRSRSIALGFSAVVAVFYFLFVDIPNPSVGITHLLSLIFGS